MFRFITWIIALGLMISLPLAAQDEATDAEPGATEDEIAAEPGDGAAAEDDEDDGSPEYADDLNDFIPSSEVPPDEQVTFPVDI